MVRQVANGVAHLRQQSGDGQNPDQYERRRAGQADDRDGQRSIDPVFLQPNHEWAQRAHQNEGRDQHDQDRHQDTEQPHAAHGDGDRNDRLVRYLDAMDGDLHVTRAVMIALIHRVECGNVGPNQIRR